MKYNQFEMAFGQKYGGFPEIRSRDSPPGEVDSAVPSGTAGSGEGVSGTVGNFVAWIGVLGSRGVDVWHAYCTDGAPHRVGPV